MRHIISALDLNGDELLQLFRRTEDNLQPHGRTVYGGDIDPLRRRILALLFYQPSTRTRHSFESAMLRAGGQTMGENDPKFSSLVKGESLGDTIRVISGYSDVIVLRHETNGIVEQIAHRSKVPVINGGDGTREHPTQGYLDVFMPWFGMQQKILPDELVLGLYGDMANSRTVRSFLRILAYRAEALKMKVKRVLHGGPGEHGRLPNDLLAELKLCDLPLEYSGEYPDPNVDYMYITRPQKEYDGEARPPYPDFAKIDLAFLARMPSHARISHPLPRNNEISEEIDEHTPQAWFFKQTDIGVPLRTNLITMLLNGALR